MSLLSQLVNKMSTVWPKCVCFLSKMWQLKSRSTGLSKMACFGCSFFDQSDPCSKDTVIQSVGRDLVPLWSCKRDMKVYLNSIHVRENIGEWQLIVNRTGIAPDLALEVTF